MDSCWNHKSKKGKYICKVCWNYFCKECFSKSEGLCKDCIQKRKEIKPQSSKTPDSNSNFTPHIFVYLFLSVLTILIAFYVLFISKTPVSNVSKKKPIKKPNSVKSFTVKEKNISVTADSKMTAEELLKKALYYQKVLPSHLGIENSYDSKIKIFSFSAAKDYAAETGKPFWSEGYSDTKRGRIYIIADFEDNSVLVHELSHLFFDNYIDYQTPHATWIDEGLAILEQMKVDTVVKQNMRESLDSIKSGNYYPLKTLGKVNIIKETNKDEINRWYSQSASAVFFIKKKYGSDKFKDLLIKMKNKVTFEKAVEQLYKTNLTSLQNDWYKDVKASPAYF